MMWCSRTKSTEFERSPVKCPLGGNAGSDITESEKCVCPLSSLPNHCTEQKGMTWAAHRRCPTVVKDLAALVRGHWNQWATTWVTPYKIAVWRVMWGMSIGFDPVISIILIAVIWFYTCDFSYRSHQLMSVYTKKTYDP